MRIRPFRALRPVPAAASAVASVPYDVVTRAEARQLAAGNSLSFLHVTRAEIDLDPEVGAYDERVYRRAAESFETLKAQAPLVVEEAASLYFYRLQQGAHRQTGIAGCFSLSEYDQGLVRRHERTRADKEDDRTRHMLAVGAQTGIVFLVHRASESVDAVADRVCQLPPLLDLSAADGVRHSVWRLDPADAAAVVDAFARLPSLYIADGHHRIASAARARQALASSRGDDQEAEAGFFLGVAFPAMQTRILPYHRAVTDLAPLTPAEFLDAVQTRFPVQVDVDPAPDKGAVAMYLGGRWYGVDLQGRARTGEPGGVSGTLDVAVLQDQILAPVLEVADVRTDPRMMFIGGNRGIEALQALVDGREAAVVFSVAAVTSEELFAVSDAGEMMPPKSTWFEPKLRDGLLSHLI